MPRTRVTVNKSGARALLNDPKVRAMLREQAERVAERARAIAPVESGEYRDSITVESATTDRAVERVVAKVPYAGVVEAKTGNLARALGNEGG